MRAAQVATALLLIAAAGSACKQILGVGDVDFGTGGAGGGSTASASSSSSSSSTSASSGTAGSSSASSSSSTSASSSGAPCNIIHAGGGTCEFLPGQECGCPADKKCSVLDESGEAGCVFTGTKPSYAHCTVDADCAAGSYCNPNTQACQPFCVSVADCLLHGGGACVPVHKADGVTPVPDVSVCAAHCDLVSGMPCGKGLTCVYEPGPNELDCVLSQGLLEHSSCSTDSDCAVELGCVALFGVPKQCTRWCSPVSVFGANGCVLGEMCYGFNPPILKDGVEYGACGP